MSREIKMQLESELGNLILKYKNKLNAGEINESIVGNVFCTACACSVRLNPNLIYEAIEQVKKDHIEFINDNFERVKRHYHERI